ncbi:MAG: hypothetical protein K8U57_07185 [Planctomycetes bacterium]|nr:hypothetical protein [Planctomycetota bacterium]
MAAAMLHSLFHPRAMDDFPGPFARLAREVTEELRRDWERTCREAAENRRLEELHATRDDYHALLKGHLRLLEEYLSLTEIHQRAFGPNPVWISEMSRAVEELKQLYDELFPRWQSSHDLAQILTEKFSLPAEKLRELAGTHSPPTSWFEETDDPFSAK